MEMPFIPEHKVVEGIEYPALVQVDSSDKNKPPYDVIIHDESGAGTCPCVGFNYRRYCKHLTEARKRLGIHI